MRLKDLLLGSVITLVITIIGGVLVYYLTREPRELLAERLTFSAEPIVGFETSTNKLAISSIRTVNLGNVVARNVRITIEFPAYIKIVDKAISSSVGDVAGATLDDNGDGKLLVSTKTILPNETLAITLLLSARPPSEPNVSVRSDNSVGASGSITRTREVNAFGDKVLPILLPLLFLLQFPLIFKLRTALRSRIRNSGSLNNTAFLYLHKGLIKEAKALLQDAINKGQADTYVLANRGLCDCLEGDFESANIHIEAALFYGKTAHEKNLTYFNRGLVRLMEGKADEGVKDLRLALKSKEIRSYLTYSSLFAKMRENNPSLDAELAKEA